MSPEDEELFRQNCEGMEENFQYMFDCQELSRMPTKAEITKVFPIMRAKMEADEWGDSTQEMVAILCSVTDITTTLS